jgi:YebC/PmpR family DNA-binding regulatory protein
MSGHNKWSTIKRKKGALDAKRSKIFSRIIKEISIAIREGGNDPDGNARLRLALQNAKGANMPKENIQRALTKADKEATNFQEVNFEGYGPHGIAIFVEALTDNNQRTVSAIRAIFSKKGGNMGTNGSLSFLFDRKGVIVVPKGTIDMEEFELAMIEAGAEDLDVSDESIEITTAVEDFANVRKKLEEMKIEAENAELQRIPKETKTLDVDASVKVLRMIDEFEDNDDVQNVYHNLEITDEVMKALESEE